MGLIGFIKKDNMESIYNLVPVESTIYSQKSPTVRMPRKNPKPISVIGSTFDARVRRDSLAQVRQEEEGKLLV